MKILVNCFACSPYKGSEAGMGGNFVKALSRHHELYVITASQGEIEKYLNGGEITNTHFYFVDGRHSRLLSTMIKLFPPVYYWWYTHWQKKALALARGICEKEAIDIIHQLNMVGYREPGFLYRLNYPIVWGPIGGTTNTPWCMLTHIGLYGFIFYGSRNLINSFQLRFARRVRTMISHCDALVTATQGEHDAFLRHYHKDSEIISEVGCLVGQTFSRVTTREDGQKLKIAWSGQHTPTKALNILLEAIAVSPYRDKIELHVLGYGRYTRKWKNLAEKLKLGDITWYGWLDKKTATEVMGGAHLFCITSLQDLTSTVLLEAISLGLPVMALNHCGFANVITDECGIKIGIHSKKQIIKDYSDAIGRIYESEPYRRKLSEGALLRAQDYKWEDKAEKLNAIYEEVK